MSDQSALVARLRAAGCVFAEDEARLLVSAARTPDDLTALADRRVAGVPLEHVIGWADFCGLRIAVDPGVFVPRRRTEFLARQAAALAAQHPVVVDLCCGSGAVGAVLLAVLDGVELHAVDLDPAAVRCVRRNMARADAYVYEGDLYQPLPSRLRGRVDVVVGNAPYVPTDALHLMPPEARLYEPRLALDGGPDGLDILRRVIAGAPQWLAPRGLLLVETSADQAPHLVASAAATGLVARVACCEELDAAVVIATRPTGNPRPVAYRPGMTEPEDVAEPVLDAYRRVREAERDTDEHEFVPQDPTNLRSGTDLRQHDPRGDDQPTAATPELPPQRGQRTR
jgi:release factor glutamine methyltransferase